ncbi:glycosyltransferase family 2 protein [Spirochaeta africana]|uniref:Glycosyl transferase n=1 Tax=Spirochaeta africana (strain ATCC 700263 / DSM 8902 / Z-7692) TaxID=889378 RepID=H9UF44_SPIAZ|nr:glycosyltransferase family 2 protein [Spirochaeta africana]AFG36137.1 glycosyl transferase [Spirochaeta africana DSM 8902]
MSETTPAAISIVVPVHNEEGNVAELHREIVQVCEANGYTYEIIFADDGSRDRTWQIMQGLRPLTAIRLRKNFGQTAAMDAGIKQAQYPYIVTMDGDRQNDPADIPRLLQALEEQRVDIVSGWRKNRKDSFAKRFTSLGARMLRRVLINDGIHDSGCSLKVYKSDCFRGLTLYGEMHRFIPAILKIKGFTIGEIEVHHRPRTAGKTKYNWKRSVKGFLDMISVWFWEKYAVRPLHLLGGLGILALLLAFGVTGIGIGFYMARITLFRFFLPVLAAFLYITSLQLLIFGLMADMMAKSYFGTTKDTPYSVAEVQEQK